jgi:PST family polysaccharide transporter
MNIKQKAIQGVVWSVIQNWGSQAGSLIVFLILARLLTPEAFGLVALANVFLAFMQIFLEQGFTQALIQRQELEPEHLDTAFWTNFFSGILLTIIGFAFASSVANIFNQPKLIPILQCFSGLFVINSLSHVHQAILSRELAFKIMAVRTLIGILIGGIVGVVMAVSGFGVWSLVSQQVVFETNKY